MSNIQNVSEFSHPSLEVLISSDRLQQRVKELGKQITIDYKGKTVVLVGVLKGACVFMSDLMRHIDLRVTLDFISVSSYGNESKTSGEVRILKDLDTSLKDCHILMVEDIVDTGLTLSYLVDNFRRREAASVNIVALLDKTDCHLAKVDIAYVGFQIPNAFVVGYGLDYAERYRNLPFVASLKLEKQNN